VTSSKQLFEFSHHEPAIMTSGTPLPFEHDVLADSTTHFRLLHILYGDFGQHVECEISSWPIDDAPSYYAISYTWGDPADTSEITVNGKSMVVRRNCEYVLQQAFAAKASRYFWVDAICIAQTSVQERNHQVGIMGKIYSGAKHVFACVGPHADDSEYLMAFIKKKYSILKRINSWGQSLVDYNAIDRYRTFWFNHMDKHVWLQLRCLFTTHTSERLGVVKAFVSFMNRPYFTRVWVLQELHLATQMSYCCGMDVQPGKHVRALDTLLEYWMRFHDEYPIKRANGPPIKRANGYPARMLRMCFPVDSPTKKLLESLYFEFMITGEPGVCLRLGVSAQKQELGEMLRLLHDFHCVDARDNLYGILSLVRWPDKHGPTPDYTKDNFEVTKHVLKLLGQEGIDDSLLFRCYLLLKLFDVTLELASLRNAIALRSSSAPQADVRLQGHHASKLGKVQTNWRGIQISDARQISDSTVSQGQGKLCLKYEAQEQHQGFIRGEAGLKLTVCTPSATKADDWFVVSDPLVHYADCGLILRESEDQRYMIVGPALVERTVKLEISSDALKESDFTGWTDPEDILVLAWALEQFPREKAADTDIQRFVNMRVCGWNDSSYFERGLGDAPTDSYEKS
jgi:hypothetical protein